MPACRPRRSSGCLRGRDHVPSSTRVEDTTVVRYARRGNASADYHAVDSRPFESAFLLKRYDWSSTHCLRRRRIKPKHADCDAYELSSGRLGPRRLMRTRLNVYAAKRRVSVVCCLSATALCLLAGTKTTLQSNSSVARTSRRQRYRPCRPTLNTSYTMRRISVLRQSRASRR